MIVKENYSLAKVSTERSQEEGIRTRKNHASGQRARARLPDAQVWGVAIRSSMATVLKLIKMAGMYCKRRNPYARILNAPWGGMTITKEGCRK